MLKDLYEKFILAQLKVVEQNDAECSLERYFTLSQFAGYLVRNQFYAIRDGYYKGAVMMGTVLTITLGATPLFVIAGLPTHTIILYFGFTAIPLASTVISFEVGEGIINNLLDIGDALYPGDAITVDWTLGLIGTDQEVHHE